MQKSGVLITNSYFNTDLAIKSFPQNEREGMPQSVHERIEFEDNLIEEQQRKESQRQEVQDAINQFLAKGRQIEILPPQLVQTRSVVGGEQWSDYENIDDVLPFNSR